jgi:hypothetical protein
MRSDNHDNRASSGSAEKMIGQGRHPHGKKDRFILDAELTGYWWASMVSAMFEMVSVTTIVIPDRRPMGTFFRGNAGNKDLPLSRLLLFHHSPTHRSPSRPYQRHSSNRPDTSHYTLNCSGLSRPHHAFVFCRPCKDTDPSRRRQNQGQSHFLQRSSLIARASEAQHALHFRCSSRSFTC